MTREDWDDIWQRVHDAAEARGEPPNAAIRIANEFMVNNGHGPRPEETK